MLRLAQCSFSFRVDVGSVFAKISTHVPVAQLDRAFACGAKGRWFESSRAYHDFMKMTKNGFLGAVFLLGLILSYLD